MRGKNKYLIFIYYDLYITYYLFFLAYVYLNVCFWSTTQLSVDKH